MRLGVRPLLWSKFLVDWVITCNIVRTHFLKKESKSFIQRIKFFSLR
jgi:hypothetical protein